MEKGKDVRELVITELLDVQAISLVKMPAIEVNFLTFKESKMNITFAKVEKDKQVLTGPAMIPDKEIFRYDPKTNEEYFVWFSKETVEQVSQQYLIKDRNSNVTLDHESDVSQVSLIESWIVVDANVDKAKALGFDVPVGTWMVSMKVDDNELWEEIIKTEEVAGFSVEGYFLETYGKAMRPEDKLIAEVEAWLVDTVKSFEALQITLPEDQVAVIENYLDEKLKNE